MVGRDVEMSESGQNDVGSESDGRALKSDENRRHLMQSSAQNVFLATKPVALQTYDLGDAYIGGTQQKPQYRTNSGVDVFLKAELMDLFGKCGQLQVVGLQSPSDKPLRGLTLGKCIYECVAHSASLQGTIQSFCVIKVY